MSSIFASSASVTSSPLETWSVPRFKEDPCITKKSRMRENDKHVSGAAEARARPGGNRALRPARLCSRGGTLQSAAHASSRRLTARTEKDNDVAEDGAGGDVHRLVGIHESSDIRKSRHPQRVPGHRIEKQHVEGDLLPPEVHQQLPRQVEAADAATAETDEVDSHDMACFDEGLRVTTHDLALLPQPHREERARDAMRDAATGET
eukprot:CAMPEP_0176158408 /NCGR_PEP_ID=MMETSP0120_2-20121206/81016_1 /TAXON_ID=160619 /ORGANISM="Kryptoperidinium foliaceum, Strain CCMP 1326" /LENGTH=205 /DNA_ID=CAMNT_0017495765 /DNA_START=362 /DNA_END=982 /DNA_ORIENTATION=+